MKSMQKENQDSLQKIADLIYFSDSFLCGRPVSPCSVGISLRPQETAEETPHDESDSAPDTQKKSSFSTDSIAAKISTCTRCGLCKTRTNTVPGVGVQNPVVMIIGEGPGADEDAQGEPFVGKAGQLLDKMLAAIRLSRKTNCYIANIVKCRPPNNRDPLPEEASACRSFLDAQIFALKPKMILCVGRVAIQNLLNTSQGITRIRGKFFEYQDIPVMATYHPSALLRDETLKRDAWEDLKSFRARLEEITGQDFGGAK